MIGTASPHLTHAFQWCWPKHVCMAPSTSRLPKDPSHQYSAACIVWWTHCSQQTISLAPHTSRQTLTFAYGVGSDYRQRRQIWKAHRTRTCGTTCRHSRTMHFVSKSWAWLGGTYSLTSAETLLRTGGSHFYRALSCEPCSIPLNMHCVKACRQHSTSS